MTAESARLPWPLRDPCTCGEPREGYIETRNGQDCVFCARCGRHNYNAPRAETGRDVRTVRSRPDIRPATRARILSRDNARCFMCGRGPAQGVNLHVGHLISVDAGRREGLTEAQIGSDENLAAQCDECNLGLGDDPVTLRLMATTLRARLSTTFARPF